MLSSKVDIYTRLPRKIFQLNHTIIIIVHLLALSMLEFSRKFQFIIKSCLSIRILVGTIVMPLRLDLGSSVEVKSSQAKQVTIAQSSVTLNK